MKTFGKVILPLSIPELLVYEIPTPLIKRVCIGVRVIVPFRNNKFITGIIADINSNVPSFKTKQIIDILESSPTINHLQYELYNWISDYYMCYLGEVIKAGLPACLNITSETKIQFNNEYKIEDIAKILTEEEFAFIKEFGLTKEIPLSKIKSISKTTIQKLIDAKVLISYNSLQNKYVPKKVKMISLNPNFFSFKDSNQTSNLKDKLPNLFNELKNKPKQLNILLEYFKKIPMKPIDFEQTFIIKSYFNKETISSSALNTLIKKNIFIEKEVLISRFKDIRQKEYSFNLSAEQSIALTKIKNSFKESKPALLHGITGSGKTEIYISLIKDIIHKKGQTLFMMPEIALTIQMIQRLRNVFGNDLLVYHSKYSDNERMEVWNAVKEAKAKIIIGTRSAIFLPFNKLNLIIVDEEHDISYKQFDPAPRYNARDCALMLSKIHNSNIILGSATPSIESYYNAKMGKFVLVELMSRYNSMALPEIKLIDLRIKNKATSSSNRTNYEDNIENTYLLLKAKNALEVTKDDTIYDQNELTVQLIDEIKSNLNQKKQVIIFQNRRGYAPYVICEACSWVPKCFQCDVSLTFHKKENLLKCHYCNSTSSPFKHCQECNSPYIKNSSFGTEKLESILKNIFPSHNISRMDSETTKSKASYEKIIKGIEDEKIDILIGTQMLSKGFDFNKVALVGIVDVDRLIRFPDFRASERAFQIITQVSGRAGRRGSQGKVLIQTYDPQQPIFKFIEENNYPAFFSKELKERKIFNYPPYIKIIKIILKHNDYIALMQRTRSFGYRLNTEFQRDNNKDCFKILGPQKPIISKIKSYYQMNFWVKVYDRKGLSNIKHSINNFVNNFISNNKDLRVMFDVDPY